MARDEKARESEEETSLLDRRNYLKLAGAAAATVAATNVSNSAAAATDYETITVDSGTTFEYSLSDGEVWENKLIDITASGSALRIDASADDWTIRNIGVRGVNDGMYDDATIFARTNSASATGTIENVYLGDGAGGGDPSETDTTRVIGIYVDRNHAGTITIDNVCLRNFPNNGIYGSNCGNPDWKKYPGAGGDVIIKNSYAEKCASSQFRVGTDGSRIENCVAVDGHDRGFWADENGNPTAIDCDASGNAQEFCAGSPDTPDTTFTVKRCESSDYSQTWSACGGTLDGTLGNNPRTTPPSGVPTSPEEAASGGSNDGSTSDPTGKVLELVANENASSVTYEFTVEGSVQKRTSGDRSAEDNDTITDNGDGTVTVSGLSGNGYGDSFLVDGTVTSMTLDESKWTIYYDGTEVSVAELTESLSKTIVLDGGAYPDATSSYSFTVSGDVKKSSELGSTNSGDTISGSDVSGSVGGGVDAFDFSGEITNLTLDGNVSVSVDGVSSASTDGGSLPNVFVIDGSEYPDRMDYTVNVTGDVEKNSELGSPNSGDSISGGEVTGAVGGGKDAFDFSGEVTSVDLDGPGTARFEDGQ